MELQSSWTRQSFLDSSWEMVLVCSSSPGLQKVKTMCFECFENKAASSLISNQQCESYELKKKPKTKQFGVFLGGLTSKTIRLSIPKPQPVVIFTTTSTSRPRLAADAAGGRVSPASPSSASALTGRLVARPVRKSRWEFQAEKAENVSGAQGTGVFGVVDELLVFLKRPY